MFKTSWKIGRLSGFNIEINLTFLILLLLVVLTQGVLAGLVLAVVVFGSVVLHELGHAIVARRLGVPISGIELHFFGGVAKMTAPPRSPRDEILIAAAGPAVSFALGAVGWLAGWATTLHLFYVLGWVNLILGGFNLLPALPMDGGRILRAALARRMGRFEATMVAVKIAYGLAMAGGILAIVYGAFNLALLAAVVAFMAWQEKSMAGMWRYAEEQPAMELLNRDGSSAGYYSGSGRPVYGEYESEWSSPDSPLPRARGGRVRRIYRLPDGGYVVIEQMRW